MVGWGSLGGAIIVGLIGLFSTNLPHLVKICLVPVYVLVLGYLLYFYVLILSDRRGAYCDLKVRLQAGHMVIREIC